MFQSFAITIHFDAQIVPSLVSESLFQLAFASFLHDLNNLWNIPCFAGSSYTFPVPDMKSDISQRALIPSSGKLYLEATIWALEVLITSR